MALGQLDTHKPKNEAGALPQIIYKINSKWIQDLSARVRTTKLLEGNTDINLPNLDWVTLSSIRHKNTSNRRKNRSAGLHQNAKLHVSQNTIQKSKKTIHRMRENICKLCV